MRASCRDQPALRRPDEDVPGVGELADGGRREVMVQFLDGTVRLCRVISWQRDREPGVWRCLLRWGVLGELYQEWYLFDAERVSSAGAAEA
jgi:hypothetical protein